MTLTNEQRNTILTLHNEERKSVNAPALTWDNKLAAAAQAWVDGAGATGDHDPNRGDCGENMASGTGGGSVDSGVQLWLDEKEEYNGEGITSDNYQAFGHYTQMIWRASTRIGCGWRKTADGGFALCCRYAPAGNMIGRRPSD